MDTMKYRSLLGSDLKISEIGFGLWTVSTGWWGNYTDDEAVVLMRLALDHGMNLFDAADTYGNGRSEELLAKAFPGSERDKVVIATKVGYDFVNHGDGRRGQKEIPQNFSPEAIRSAVESALSRLNTDHIDILQLHNIREDQVHDDDLWEVMEDLRKEGKFRHGGIALGPAIGWLGEGGSAIAKRKPEIVQHIYNLLEQHPGCDLHKIAEATGAPTRFLIRVPHSSGMLEGKYTAETVFPPNDHRNHRPKSWLLNGVKKIEQLRFLERADRTMGQAAMQWLLEDTKTLSVLPNIYSAEQIREFSATSECPLLERAELERIKELVSAHFGLEPEETKHKGDMPLPAELVTMISGLEKE